MGIKLNAIGVLNNDKANPNTRHKYYPDVTFPTPKGPLKNRDIAKKDRVYVQCDYLTVGNRGEYATIDVTGRSRIDFAELFKGQVVEIHNLDHPTEDREITIDELLNVFGGEGSSVAQDLITDVAVHLMKGSSLDEEEQKN
jgi:hypothetical protein